MNIIDINWLIYIKFSEYCCLVSNCTALYYGVWGFVQEIGCADVAHQANTWMETCDKCILSYPHQFIINNLFSCLVLWGVSSWPSLTNITVFQVKQLVRADNSLFNPLAPALSAHCTQWLGTLLADSYSDFLSITLCVNCSEISAL